MIIYDYEVARVSQLGDRRINQDRSLVLAQGGDLLLAVADGLGGHPRGEVAAQLFVDSCEHLFRKAAKPIEDPQDFFQYCVTRAHDAVQRFGAAQRPPVAPMTTMVMCLIQDHAVSWSHMGDSRLYLVRDGRLVDGTVDHSQVVEMEMPGGNGGSFARTVVTRCIGSQNHPVEVEYQERKPLAVNDNLLLCSDGLWGQLGERTLIEAVSSDEQVASILDLLGDLAARNGQPRSDNITAIMLRPVR